MSTSDCMQPQTSSDEAISLDHICNVNINKLISDVDRLVVKLKENNEFANVINASTTLRDIVRQANEGHMSLKRLDSSSAYNFDSVPMESKPSCTYQLRELDAENRHLRSLYEDSQLTLFLLMQKHRKLILGLCEEKKNDVLDPMSEIRILNDKLIDKEYKQNCEKFVDVAVGLNEIVKNEEQKRKVVEQEIDDLTMKNAILRELLNAEDPRNIDVNALIDKIENKIL
ncbi:unnamed protein product [Auanema sp. JU1783]|nr:unnamed protein product [Auanema sp. JU1783]